MDFMDKECPFCTSAREEDRIEDLLKEEWVRYLIFFRNFIFEKADVYRDPLYVDLSAEKKDRLFVILKD
jgi:hypothetical protein